MDIFEILAQLGIALTEQQKADLQQQMEQNYYSREQHTKELKDMQFEHRLEREIGKAKGRSNKAIRAMLDLDMLRESDQQENAICAALEQLKQENSYLFEAEITMPIYASGTGTGTLPRQDAVLRAAFGLTQQ